MDLLPLGSIVVLRDGYKKLIIIGRKILVGRGEELSDYLGCLYPEGYLGEEYCYVFNNSDIDQIIFRGFEDLEEKAFIKVINDIE
jgi:hypothetical protein